ncbi:MAG: helix-turn-helix transcriptional regulator [Bacteroidota bacterium]|nr:helix-turn-helix transcriptional regulator [Bacteroidota bacterium]
MATQNKTDTTQILKLADRIKELRIKKGYTSYEYFAYDHGLSRSQYGRYEKGTDIRFSSLMKVIEAFEMTPAEFFFNWIPDEPKKTKKKP